MTSAEQYLFAQNSKEQLQKKIKSAQQHKRNIAEIKLLPRKTNIELYTKTNACLEEPMQFTENNFLLRTTNEFIDKHAIAQNKRVTCIIKTTDFTQLNE